jgi:hypothetical protein
MGCVGRDPRTAWGLNALLEIVRSLPMVLTDLSLKGISLEIHKGNTSRYFHNVFIGLPNFSDAKQFMTKGGLLSKTLKIYHKISNKSQVFL